MTDIPNPTQLGAIYTEDEAAARLKIGRRVIITLGRRYGCCSVRGRTTRFSEQDLLDLWQILRAPPKEPKPTPVRVTLPWAASAWFRDLSRRQADQRAERDRLRKERQALERERRLEAKRQASRAKVDARAAKRAAALEAKRKPVADIEPLDVNNRDPAYWTDERKKRLRQERLARMNGGAE